MARICYVNVTTEQSSQSFFSVLERLFKMCLRPETHVDIKCVSPGLNRATDGIYNYFALLNKVSIIEKLIEAQSEGYDAAVVGCFMDVGVSEAREVLNMPVIPIAEASMLMACLLGRKFAIIVLNEPKEVAKIEGLIELYGLKGRAITNPVRRISLSTFEVFTKAQQDWQIVATDVLTVTKQCVEDGADVVVIGCNGLGPLCTVSGLCRVDESAVPILDCLTMGLKMAELASDLKGNLGLPFTSRGGYYISPSDKDMRRVRAVFGLKTDI